MNTNTYNPFVLLGIGTGIGVCTLWVLVELWPIIALGGVAYIIYQGTKNTTKENINDTNLDNR